MLYESLSQGTIFVLMSIGGFSSGFIIDLCNFLSTLFKNTKIFKQIFLFFAFFCVFFVAYILNLKINYGQLRNFSLISFILAFSIQRFLSLNFLAKFINRCYNKQKENFDAKRKKVEKS